MSVDIVVDLIQILKPREVQAKEKYEQLASQQPSSTPSSSSSHSSGSSYSYPTTDPVKIITGKGSPPASQQHPSQPPPNTQSYQPKTYNKQEFLNMLSGREQDIQSQINRDTETINTVNPSSRYYTQNPLVSMGLMSGGSFTPVSGQNIRSAAEYRVQSGQKSLVSLQDTSKIVQDIPDIWGMDRFIVSSSGNVSLHTPSNKEIHESIYGTGALGTSHLIAGEVGSLGIPAIIASGIDTGLLAGPLGFAAKYIMSGGKLDMTQTKGHIDRMYEQSVSYSRKPGESDTSIISRLVMSPMTLENIVIPVVTLGLGRVYTIIKGGAVGVIDTGIISSRLSTIGATHGADVVIPALNKSLFAVGVAGSVMSGYSIGYTAATQPERTGSVIGQTAQGWFMGYAGFKVGEATAMGGFAPKNIDMQQPNIPKNIGPEAYANQLEQQGLLDMRTVMVPKNLGSAETPSAWGIESHIAPGRLSDGSPGNMIQIRATTPITPWGAKLRYTIGKFIHGDEMFEVPTRSEVISHELEHMKLFNKGLFDYDVHEAMARIAEINVKGFPVSKSESFKGFEIFTADKITPQIEIDFGKFGITKANTNVDAVIYSNKKLFAYATGDLNMEGVRIGKKMYIYGTGEGTVSFPESKYGWTAKGRTTVVDVGELTVKNIAFLGHPKAVTMTSDVWGMKSEGGTFGETDYLISKTGTPESIISTSPGKGFKLTTTETADVFGFGGKGNIGVFKFEPKLELMNTIPIKEVGTAWVMKGGKTTGIVMEDILSSNRATGSLVMQPGKTIKISEFTIPSSKYAQVLSQGVSSDLFQRGYTDFMTSSGSRSFSGYKGVLISPVISSVKVSNISNKFMVDFSASQNVVNIPVMKSSFISNVSPVHISEYASINISNVVNISALAQVQNLANIQNLINAPFSPSMTTTVNVPQIPFMFSSSHGGGGGGGSPNPFIPNYLKLKKIHPVTLAFGGKFRL